MTARTPEGRALLVLIDMLAVSILKGVNPGRDTLDQARKEAAGCVERLELAAVAAPLAPVPDGTLQRLGAVERFAAAARALAKDWRTLWPKKES